MVNQAERFINTIASDASVSIDLDSIFASDNAMVIFGVCNMIYQQVSIIPWNILYRFNKVGEIPTESS